MDEFERLSQEAANTFGLTLTPAQLHSLGRYADELLAWNQKYNLTSITTAEDIRVKHFLDSLSCRLALQDAPAGRMIDVGTGAGFPGLPLKVLYPHMQLTLVESVAKKTAFLCHIVQDLGLDAVEVVTERAEAIGQQPVHRAQYDWALARAVASLPILLEYLLPLVKVGGRVVAQKGESAPQELEASQAALEILGGDAGELIPVSLPGVKDKRYLVVVEKQRATPQKYPRRVGIPSKRPLGA